MEPNYSSSEDDKKFTDADLDILQRDLNECQKAMSQISGGSNNNFIEAFFANNPNSYSTANDSNNNLTLLPPVQTQFHHFTRLLHDFEEFETEMLPPSSQRPDQHCTTNGNGMDQNHYLAREIQESQVMIEEMADGDEDDDRPASDPIFVLQGNSSSDPSRRVNTDFPAHGVCACYDVAGGVGSGMASFSNNVDCAGGSSNSSIIQQGGLGLYLQGSSGITFFEGSSSVRYFICSSRNNFEKARKTGRKKRRYNGVVETDEETARRVEYAKIKNREAAAKAHLRKLSHEAHLQSLLLKLRKKNKFLKNVVMFLQGHKRIDVPPKTLRRSISGPI